MFVCSSVRLHDRLHVRSFVYLLVFVFDCKLFAFVLFGFALQMSVEQMAKATRGLPEFQELSKKMAQHVRLSQDCMDKVRRAWIKYVQHIPAAKRCAKWRALRSMHIACATQRLRLE